MVELKTLKDLVSWTCECNCVTFDNGICRMCGCSKLPKYGEIDYDELKEEAIRWIKEDILVYKNADLHLPAGERGMKIHNFIVQRRQFWKDRFNITEEDLK